ncbi:YheC/YheD family protein [Alteribacter natronophilus]|uniref:YheC/YheD family protein n=1 Tax=Alteribacter natronophilus TaxID=2583810 RepID=UPI00110EB83B|nr:YheC/YheD family protein [Alteribacter natronophilus]TMW71241.1 hypothetical protein FGB90_14930 [Alteribacter natronophilus]
MKLKYRDKYRMYKVMKQHPELSPHLPDTRKWRGKNEFYQMLSSHKGLVLKPNKGLKGKNIYFVTKSKNSYWLQYKNWRRRFKSRFSLFSHLDKRIGNKRYIIQKRIYTAEVKGRPFDIRVIVQLNPKSKKWKVTGYKVRVAGKGMLITNANAGGKVVSYKMAMQHSALPESKWEGLLKKTKEVSLRSAEVMGESYKGHRIFGTDIGVTKDGKAIIFEINRHPLIKGFTKKHLKTIRNYKRMN